VHICTKSAKKYILADFVEINPHLPAAPFHKVIICNIIDGAYLKLLVIKLQLKRHRLMNMQLISCY